MSCRQGALYVVVEEAEKAGVQADVDYVVDQMIMMLFAGTETTATSFISACLMLDGRHDIMDRLREELRVGCHLPRTTPVAPMPRPLIGTVGSLLHPPKARHLHVVKALAAEPSHQPAASALHTRHRQRAPAHQATCAARVPQDAPRV